MIQNGLYFTTLSRFRQQIFRILFSEANIHPRLYITLCILHDFLQTLPAGSGTRPLFPPESPRFPPGTTILSLCGHRLSASFSSFIFLFSPASVRIIDLHNCFDNFHLRRVIHILHSVFHNCFFFVFQCLYRYLHISSNPAAAVFPLPDFSFFLYIIHKIRRGSEHFHKWSEMGQNLKNFPAALQKKQVRGLYRCCLHSLSMHWKRTKKAPSRRRAPREKFTG